MKEYTTKHGQCLYDISLVLYGSIEGIFDILANNDISINDDIPAGTVIKYDEDFLVNPQIKKWLEDNNVNVANESSCIDYTDIADKTLRFVVVQEGPTSVISITLNSGTMYIDWGDGTAADIITGSAEIDHPYSDEGRHEIRVFGDFSLKNLDLTEIGGIYYALTACRVTGTFTEATNRSDLKTLFL